jgi:hypothetical protein
MRSQGQTYQIAYRLRKGDRLCGFLNQVKVHLKDFLCRRSLFEQFKPQREIRDNFIPAQLLPLFQQLTQQLNAQQLLLMGGNSKISVEVMVVISPSTPRS